MKEANKEIELNEEQKQALEKVKAWLNGDERFMTLMGFAGTGKTTLLDFIVDHAVKELKKDTVVTATTNKAVKVLREKIDHNRFMTIHSLLNIKPVKKGTKEVFEPVRFDKEDISQYKLIIIDECSMISKKLIGIIEEQLTYFEDQQVLFCGDPAQLQPINEEKSKTFHFDPAVLETVVRHGDTIAQKAKLVRESDLHVPVEDLIEPPIINWIDTKDAISMFQDFREEPDYVRALCWTNRKVDYWNRVFRRADIGETDLPFAKTDIIIANKPCIEETPYGDNILMHNSEEAEVKSVKEHYDCYTLEVRTLENGRHATLRVIKDEYKDDHEKSLRGYAAAKSWTEFWSEKKRYHDIRHCYAITTHKSQGSTFDNVVIDYKDINNHPNIEERNQLLYVAMTRAADRVYFLK